MQSDINDGLESPRCTDVGLLSRLEGRGCVFANARSPPLSPQPIPNFATRCAASKSCGVDHRNFHSTNPPECLVPVHRKCKGNISTRTFRVWDHKWRDAVRFDPMDASKISCTRHVKRGANTGQRALDFAVLRDLPSSLQVGAVDVFITTTYRQRNTRAST